MASNRITKVAITGAGGNIGSVLTEGLLNNGKHTITALTRADSQSKLPDGVIAKKVDYNDIPSLVEVLIGQDALIITLNGYTSKEVDKNLIHAAAEAGVKWIVPNEWAPDTANKELAADVFVFQPHEGIRQLIVDLGKSSYIALATGFWYEWSLAIPAAYGLDFANRSMTFFDEGETKMSTSTWPQVGRAVASLLSLPIVPEQPNPKASLENLKNKLLYLSSFTISQKEMFESALRVTGTKESDWTISRESTQERYAKGLKEMHEGRLEGFAKMLYTRVFYPDGSGDYENSKGTVNALLGLPKEDLDAATKAAEVRSRTHPFGA
ncbi:hypothetical protein N7474_011053 [Penicillium riverlandense]|uniref:uncharacterized protein n=1 Tax=Penicillium riverlandense TaxID=1903569 RepID=UPI002546809E|nr:uncharacterized protein N7474_011053 [Penicillium riverlandense]KAJ5805166.1 hypothetical protein N7474_011053 [Penicillium riverlandense]